jgi:hypothetical protein
MLSSMSMVVRTPLLWMVLEGVEMSPPAADTFGSY